MEPLVGPGSKEVSKNDTNMSKEHREGLEEVPFGQV